MSTTKATPGAGITAPHTVEPSSGPFTITEGHRGGWNIFDALHRLVAMTVPPGPDQRLGSPQRKDVGRANAELFTAAARYREALEEIARFDVEGWPAKRARAALAGRAP